MVKIKFFLFSSPAQEKRIACMVFWITITCFLCWMPILIVYCLQVTPAYPSPFFNAVVRPILHLGVIIHAMLNLYFRGDLRNATTRFCLQNRNSSEDTEMSIIRPTSLVTNQHANINQANSSIYG